MQKANPLLILNKQRLTTIPKHFKRCRCKAASNQFNEIVAWIENNLQGRYFFGFTPGIKPTVVAAFEKHNELTFFILSCPYIKGDTND
jgi:hypothetical protein